MRATGALSSYTRAFAFLDLACLLISSAVVTHTATTSTSDDADGDNDDDRRSSGRLRVPSAEDAQPIAMAQPEWAQLNTRQQRAAVERQRQLLIQPVAHAVLRRIFRPGRAPRPPPGGRLAGVSTDGISGT